MSRSIELIKAPAPTVKNTVSRDFHLAKSIAKASMEFFALPFDMARHQYAYAQQVGLITPSIVAGAKFGRAVGALEILTLGPWARQV